MTQIAPHDRVVGVSIARGADHTRAEEISVLRSSAGILLEAPPWSLGAEQTSHLV
jgi:hypothetical protein